MGFPLADYRDHKLPEYNRNPMIQALPPILSNDQFIDAVTQLPDFSPHEMELEAKYRFHCIERLSRYFDPQHESLYLYEAICTLIMQGYLGRNLLEPEYAGRSQQIYSAINAKAGKKLEEHVNVPTSASSLTLIGPSGIGKTTNLINILRLFPQVINHSDYSVYQLVWIKVDCPHAGSLKGLCIDIFLAVDKALGTNYAKKFGNTRNSEDYMLAQVSQIAHTQHLGVLVIDEMQNLVNVKRGRDALLNFLVKLDNIIGIPVIRIGTSEAFPIFQGNFRNARRATGNGLILWDRMKKNHQAKDSEDWSYFIDGIWEYQWTKTITPLTQEIRDVLYDECQGIIDIAIKLYKMVQWRAIALGGEEVITAKLIRQVAKEGLPLVKPMLSYIRDGDKKEDWSIKYKDICSVNEFEYQSKCLTDLRKNELDEIRKKNRLERNKSKYQSKVLRFVINELLNLELEPDMAKQYAEKVVKDNSKETDISSLVKEAYGLFLGRDDSVEPQKKGKTSKKSKPTYQDNDMRGIVEVAKKKKTSAHSALKLAFIVKDETVQEFLSER